MTEKSRKSRQEFVAAVNEVYGDITTINRKQIKGICSKYKLSWPSFIVGDKALRADRGLFYMPNVDSDGNTIYPKNTEKKVAKVVATEDKPVAKVAKQENDIAIDSLSSMSFIPPSNNNFVSWGEASTLKKIIKSDIFFPTFITGLSGNGKTFMVEQTCAALNKEMFRVNLTIETDEDDLIGGFRLLNGDTVWHNGPVIEAMQRGAILLLDEIDLASNKIMCLQPILEGSGIYIKKIGKYIQPAPGFNIIATANTKGRGSESGMFIGTNILNEAFLERFCITIEQSYPTNTQETKILTKTYESLADKIVTDDDSNFINNLITWANTIRTSFTEGILDDIITTRRLIHILKLYSILNDKKKSIQYSIARFDSDVQASFIDLYSKIDNLFDDASKEDDTTTDKNEVAPPW